MRGQRIDAVYAEIMKKTAKYGRSPRHSIHLMLYTTDWHFSLEGSSGDLLAHILNRREHCFATVVFCRPMPGESRMMKRMLFPLSMRELKALEGEQMLRQITEIVFDPRAEIVVLDKDRKEVRKPRAPAEPTRPQ